MSEQARDVISEMTMEQIVDKVFEELRMYVGPDATGLAYISTNPNEEKVVIAGNKTSVYYQTLRYIARNKMEFIEG